MNFGCQEQVVILKYIMFPQNNYKNYLIKNPCFSRQGFFYCSLQKDKLLKGSSIHQDRRYTN